MKSFKVSLEVPTRSWEMELKCYTLCSNTGMVMEAIQHCNPSIMLQRGTHYLVKAVFVKLYR